MRIKLDSFKVFSLFFYSQIFLIESPLLAQSKPSIAPAYSSIELAQISEAETLYSQMNQSMTSAFLGIIPFLSTLTQMENVQTDEEFLLIIQQAKPMALQIINHFSEANQVGERLIPLLPPENIQTEYLATVVSLNGEGVLAFTPWLEMLATVEQAYQNEDLEQLQTAIQKMPEITDKTIEFSRKAQSVINQGLQLASAQNSANINYDNLSPEDIQSLSNMSRMMHETNMNIINNMESEGRWEYHYGTGEEEYRHSP